jgi:tRNA pseudouridine55 synthase
MTRRGKNLEPGVLLVDKPAGPSSHAVVDWVRWVLRGTRVGHCGTLDPAATGLLVVVVGPATRLAADLTDADKCYRARFVLGRSTTTADAEGDTLEVRACTPEDAPRACEAVAGLVGDHALAPPRYSAVKVKGVAAHVLARSGSGPELELAPRSMTVRWVDEVRAVASPPGTVAVDATLEVSKGTYIRALAELLGRRLGAPAHLGALRRLRSGCASIDDPRVVGPLRASPLASSRDGKPRWRIRPDVGPEACGEDRDAQARWLGRRMLELPAAWPLPWIELSVGEGGDRVLRNLLQGRAVEIGALQAAATPSGTLVGRIGIGRSGPDAAFVVARVEQDQVRPERTVVRPDGGDTP